MSFYTIYTYSNVKNNNKNNFVANLQQQLINLRNNGNPHMQQNMVANVPNSPTSTNHNNNKAAPKWMYQPLEMILVSVQAALALYDTFVVRVSIVFGCDN